MKKTIIMQTKLIKMENRIADLERDIYNLQCKIDDSTYVNENGEADLADKLLLNKLNLKSEQLEKLSLEYSELCSQNFYYRSKINAEQQKIARAIIREQKRIKTEKRFGILTDGSKALTLESKLLFSLLQERYPSGWNTNEYMGVTKTVSWAIKEARREITFQEIEEANKTSNNDIAKLIKLSPRRKKIELDIKFNFLIKFF